MCKKNKEKSGLKILAADAKARLKNGYYNAVNETAVNYHDLVKTSFGGKETNEKEKIFYDKVKTIIDEDGVTNPISRLVDEKYLETLSYSAKQRYLLEVSEKYKKVKAEILSSLVTT